MRHFLYLLFISFALSICTLSVATAEQPEMVRYIVVLNDNVDSPGDVGLEIARQAGGQVGFVYEHALKGFSIELPQPALAGVARNPKVKYVESDNEVYAFGNFEQTIPTGIMRIFADTNSSIGIDGVDEPRVDADVAVIDTGIDLEHPDLNVMTGVNCIGFNPFKSKCVPGGDDDHYHGTHVAGIIGAIDNGIGVVGVAPGVRLWPVKVLTPTADGGATGYSSWIIAGIDWVAANADIIEVANMSLGGSGYSQAEYDAIQGAVNVGVAFAVAAGNDSDDAANYSPAAFDNVLTVSALADSDGAVGGKGPEMGYIDSNTGEFVVTDTDDTLASFSNYGDAVDIAAPGVIIESTLPLEYYDTYGYSYPLSGTSMASPHVAGALALLASVNNPQNADDVYSLYQQVLNSGNYDWTDAPYPVDSTAAPYDGIQEPLLDVSLFSVGKSNTRPTVTISNPVDGTLFDSGTSISFTGTASDSEDGTLTDNIKWYIDADTVPTFEGASFSTTLDDGNHTITAEVTDSDGATETDSISITVGGGGVITSIDNLSVTVARKGIYRAYLSWEGGDSGMIDIVRDNIIVATTDNIGTYTDNLSTKLSGSASYIVCQGNNCSNPVDISW